MTPERLKSSTKRGKKAELDNVSSERATSARRLRSGDYARKLFAQGGEG